MPWKVNSAVEWSIDNGVTWIRVTDHGRSEINVDVEPLETKQRMANGTMRKYIIAKKRTFSWSWENLPDKTSTFLANGTTHGEWLEAFYNSQDAPFLMRMREGSDHNAGTTLIRTGGVNATDTERIFTVMFSEYSKDVTKRGPVFDLWNISVTLEEV